MKTNRIKLIYPILLCGLFIASCGLTPPEDPKFEDSLTIVYSRFNLNSERVFANELESALQRANISVTIQDDSGEAPEKAILVGKTSYSSSSISNRGTYTVNNDKNYIELLGDNNGTSALIDGISYLKDTIVEAKNIDKSIYYHFDEKHTDEYEDHSIRFMSFNVLVGSKAEVDMYQRVPAAADMVNAHLPDVMGLQEYNSRWYTTSINFEALINPNYKKVGGVRDYADRNSECAPIFYNSSTVELLDSGTLWPSSTPYVPNTQYSQTMYPRVFTYGVFRHLTDGKKFLFLNTHLDLSKEARLLQIQAIEGFAKNYYSQMPVFITADYNDEYHNTGSDPYIQGCATNWLIDTKGYQNPSFIAKIRDEGYTFPSPTYSSSSESNRKIDYCLHYGDGIIDNAHYIDRNRYRDVDYSDHYAIYVDLDIYNPLGSSYLPYDKVSYPYSGTSSVEYNNTYVSQLPFRLDAPAAFQLTNGDWLNNNTFGTRFGPIKNLGNFSDGYIEYHFYMQRSAPGDLDLFLTSTRPGSTYNLANVGCTINGQTVDLSSITLPTASGWYDESHIIFKNIHLKKGDNTLRMFNKGDGCPNQLNLRVYTEAPCCNWGSINALNTNIVSKNGKVYFVSEGIMQGKLERNRVYIDLILAGQKQNHAIGKEVNVSFDQYGKFTYEIDVSNLGTGRYCPHVLFNGETFDNSNGDLRYRRPNADGQQIPNTNTISYGGKTYQIIQRYSSSADGMACLEIS